MKKTTTWISWIIVIALARIIPHPANATPLLALASLNATSLKKREFIQAMLLALLISDLSLSLCYQHNFLGSWSLYTYSALALCCYITTRFGSSAIVLAINVFSYWLITNAGTFCFSGLYPHSIEGLTACYTLALPFLKNSAIASCVWYGVFRLVQIRRHTGPKVLAQ